MQQLKVYPNDELNQAESHFIDLYEQDPIRLTMSVEDITNAEASSTFSKTFRVPATRNNNEFFKHAFLIDGIDYDVTIKKPAQVLVDGVEFRSGHIRLQKIYVNGQKDLIEYELLFLGETRDFSTKISDKNMCELSIPELTHPLNYDNISQSWQAFPEGGIDDGLFNGDVLYPLIDFGNTYEDGVPQEPRISMEGSNRFTQNSHPIAEERFKPMIRAKRLLDKIFDDAGYTYESTFLDSDLFRRLYVSAFGNEAVVDLDVNSSSADNFWVSSTDAQNVGDYSLVPFDIENSDPNDNFNLSTDTYTAPITGNYHFTASVYAVYYREESSPGGVDYDPVSARLVLLVNGIEVDQGGLQTTPAYLSYNNIIPLSAGDQVQLYVESPYGADVEYIDNREWRCISSPGAFNPTNSLDCEYKQVDFIKDILTLFRLVMSPDPFNPTNFLIEPYVDYIYTGETYDWSDKLVRDKDLEIEPLFNTQSDRIEFRFEEDEDYLNSYHQQAYKEPWGYLAFDSGNELLKGTRKVEVDFAPTPMARIEGAPATSSWIIPQLHTHESGDDGTEHLPIKAKTRLLFYNGLLPAEEPWYMINAPAQLTTYPQVSPYETFPQSSAGLNLSWANDIQYWGTGVSGYNTQGITLFQKYWQSYITDLYNKFARRVTGHFILNNVDLQNFTFNDIVFVDGVYYRPEKIIDAPIGQRAPVKVQLIKAIDYRPTEFDQPIVYTIETQGVSCFGADDGEITVNILNGLPPYDYVVDGQSGSFNQYTFTITGLSAGTTDITITEATGFSDTQSFTIPTPAELVATHVVTPESPCGGENGAIEVNATGGTAPLSIIWSDGSSSFIRNGLINGTYDFTVFSSGGQTQLVDALNPGVQTRDPDNPASATNPLEFPDISLNVDSLWRVDFPYNYFKPQDFGPFKFVLTGTVRVHQPSFSASKEFPNPFELSLGASGNQYTPTSVTGWPPTDQPGVPEPGQDYDFTLTWEGVVPAALGELEVIITPNESGVPENIIQVEDAHIKVWRQECSVSDSVVVPCNAANLEVDVESINPSLCGEADGAINLTITGGTPPYTVDWADIPGTSNPQDRTGLIEGTYTYTVTDSDSPANVVGPNDVVLICSPGGDAYPHFLAYGTTGGGACTTFDDGFAQTFWSNETPLASGSFLFNTQTGAQALDPNDYVTNGYYANDTNWFYVQNGQISFTGVCKTPVANSFCYQIVNEGPGSVTFQWTLSGLTSAPEVLYAGEFKFVCADENSVQIIGTSGGGIGSIGPAGSACSVQDPTCP